MDDETLLRYNSTIMLPEVGFEGQQTLLNSKVLIMGIGGLGSPVALYLSSCGIGELTFVDFDNIELSNLQRQIIHNSENIGKNKALCAKQQALKINPTIKIKHINKRLTDNELYNLFKPCDIIVDCTDNFDTRFAINAACVKTKKPLVSAAAIRFEAQVSVFRADKKNSPCYNCLYPQNSHQDENCTNNGVIAPLVGVIGSMQALEVIKVILDIGIRIENKLLLYDAKEVSFRTIAIKQDKSCPTCNNQALS
jgi:molybdopterin-synthase adenylyltransferase